LLFGFGFNYASNPEVLSGTGGRFCFTDTYMLDAAKIGAAANSVKLDPEAWNGWASADDILTQFRRLWHVLVLAGAPRST
jgi:hypothetical protein